MNVTCISLARRTDRREVVDRCLRPVIPNLYVMDAVDANSVGDIREDILLRMKVMPKAKEGARERKAACWNSHVVALERALETDSFPHIILEDDVIPVAALDAVPWADMPRDSVSFLAGCFQAAKVKDMKEFERDGGAHRIGSRCNTGWVTEWNRTEFRISSSSAYVVPTADVARDLLASLALKTRITHFDIDLYETAQVGSFLFPSPFVSADTARASDIMTSQSILFDTHYAPVKPSRKRPRAEP